MTSGSLAGRGHEVVHERGHLGLTILGVDEVLVQGTTDALGHAAQHLAVHDVRVEERAGIVDREVVEEVHLAGIAVDVDDRRRAWSWRR